MAIGVKLPVQGYQGIAARAKLSGLSLKAEPPNIPADEEKEKMYSRSHKMYRDMHEICYGKVWMSLYVS